MRLCQLQSRCGWDWRERILRQYDEMHEAYFRERELIPAGDFHELAFEDLEQEPVEEVRKVYAALGLPDFAHVEPKLREYVDSLAGYQKNKLRPLDPAMRSRVARQWRRSFEEWGYELSPEHTSKLARSSAGKRP